MSRIASSTERENHVTGEQPPGGGGNPRGGARSRLPVPAQGPPGGGGGLPGKVLITGGSSGIGAATACAFARRGYAVAVTGQDKAALDRVAGETGGVPIQGDLREPGRPRRVVDAAALALGGLDVVVSNAGVGWSGPFSTMTEGDIDAVLDVNLRAAAHVARAALSHLGQRAGQLAFVGSIAGLVGVPDEAWYSATKSGVGMLADVLRAELRADGIGVTLVVPGVVDTPYFDRRNVPYQRRYPRPIAARVVAAAIVDAVESRRETVVVPGWLSLPARLRGGLPGLYRMLEGGLDRGGRRRHGGKRAPAVGPAGSWPRNARA
jgi:short-subunit dehydrogenase